MKDSLHEYLKKNQAPVPPAPPDEWNRIMARTRENAKVRQHRVWFYVSAATLAAAGLMAFINFAPQAPEADALLEPEDVMYLAETPEPGTYQDWLWIVDQLAAEVDE